MMKKSMANRVFLYFEGGLGNQLFQYAFGVYVKNKFPDIDLVLDFSNYHKNNEFGLKNFRLPDYKYVHYYSAYTRLGRIISRYVSKVRRNVMYTRTISPEDSIEFYSLPKLEDRTCLKGFWQNSRYYLETQKYLQSLLKIQNPSKDFLQAIQKIAGNNFCAIHVRRGDYATFYDNSILPPEYYDKAIQVLDEEDIHFLIFSDDIKWCKEHFGKDNFEYISDIGEFKDYEELMIMSECSYHIIANSSFSWWGAYLSNSKKVVCPYYSRWDERFYMPSWIGVEVKK